MAISKLNKSNPTFRTNQTGGNPQIRFDGNSVIEFKIRAGVGQETVGTNAVGDVVCEVESVKAVADVYAPLSGEIVEVNEALADNLDAASKDPFGAGWFVKFRMSHPNEAESLMTAEQYDKHVASQG